MPSLTSKRKQKKRGKSEKTCSSHFFKVLERERELLSKISRDPIVGSLRDKKESCSMRRGLRLGTGFREFPQTPCGRGFSLLGFYSFFKYFVDV